MFYKIIWWAGFYEFCGLLGILAGSTTMFICLGKKAHWDFYRLLDILDEEFILNSPEGMLCAIIIDVVAWPVAYTVRARRIYRAVSSRL